ncbi:PREDICTED: LOW QUALITY PROTEIN: ATP-binding cassette sub-family A member 2-like [Acromyrmex echinatior]|uniref:LOW QUALITY PROTEIN: ATP-binding cassette sub-family A member 2-like n=1 Tax=Acromyrmex echinatior TaxID=103372 RepID=UPI000580EE8E|nr:PREDICTED: LOW QUALITY PROTEIN: ATP-binding cassette sub-family A member 2-like [Acromyrmex echinatior]
MLRIREIIRHPKLRRFGTRWRIFMWKAVLMRLHNRITTALEIIIAIVFSLQIRLMFEPFALHLQDLDQYSRNDILTKLPDDVQCWYAPRNAFIDELMLKATKMLHTNIQAADSEINLVHSRYAKNDTSKVLWAIFEIDKLTSGKSKVLEYKIRSSEIGENQMIMMHEEEPAYKDPYVLSGFMALQIAIEKSFVEMWTNPTLPKIADNLIIGRFPFYKVNFLILPYIIRPNISIIYYVMVVAFLLLPAATLKKALHDKQTGFRSLMRLTNISFTMLYIGWLNYLMIILLPVTIVCTILLFPVFSDANVLVIAIFIIMYNILSMLFMFTISTFFDHPTKALLTSVLFWLFLTHLTIVLDQFLITESMLWRISSLILPHSGLLYGIIAFTTYTNFVVHYVIMTFTLIDDYSENLKYMWQYRRVLPKPRNHIGPTSYLWPRWLPELITLRDAHNIIHAVEKIPVSLILFIWILHIIFWYLLAVYLDNVNPGKFGSAKPWYYLFKKPVYDDNDLIIRGSTNWSAVEHTPSYIKPSIRVRCVRKEFGRIGESITAINDVTIDFYNQEFSVILGHNGAGKSCLLKIITGMYKPTHGHVYLENGNSVYPIGYCPQENILVNYLTTIQHLYIFGMIKGMTYEDAYRESLKLLKQLDLEYVKDSKMKSCSFGTQRRICFAMALIGNTKILILDEPTYSVDPEHKRQIWDLLLDIKRHKTIIMATNSMEAADFLADRIAIIANGKIECYGSKMYLNRRYGIGYVLSLLVQEDCNVERIHTEIQEFSADPINLRSMMGLVIRFDVPRNSRFTKLLQHLEFNKEELKIVSVALSAASIEGQFLRISLESQFKERGVKLPSNKYELIVQQRRRHLLQRAEPWIRLTGDVLWRQQILAIFLKKLIHIASSWKMYTFSITVAIITLVLATIIAELSNFTLFDTTERVMNLTSYMDNNFHVLYYAADDKSIKDFLVTLYVTSQTYSEKYNCHISENIPATDLMMQPDLHSIEFRDRYVMSIDMYTDGRVQLMYSSTAIHSGPIALNLLHNALLRYHCGSDNCWIKLVSRPLPRPEQWQHLLVHPRSIRNWENAAIIITLFLLLPSIDMGIREKNTRSKMLQINAIGMSTEFIGIYWIPTYIIDFLLYAFSIIIFEIIILSIYRRTLHFSNLEIVQILMIFLCYGACAIPLGYCIQLFTRKPENAYLSVILINIVTILLVNSSVIFPWIFRVFSNGVRYVLIHIFPPYVLACALGNYIMLNLYNRQCSYFNTCDTEFYMEDPCCQNCKGKGCYKHLDVMLIKQSSFEYKHSITDDILLMVSQMFAFFILLEVFEEKNRRKWYSYFMPSEKDDDILELEVVQEKKRVEEYMKHYDETKLLPPRVALVVQNLTKKYAKKPVVNRINFSIHNQECFGLLGFNDVGKSTIYKALVGQIKISAGKAVIYEYEFTRNQEMFVGMIGYCPQINGLSDFMTGRQYLQLHAALRGVPYGSINEEVNKWLDVLDMLDFENLKIIHYPWGIQRKLCILQSLTGDLPMIFMDEPSAGIDVMTSHAICEILHQIREMGRSILITTHSMREAEAMCLRVGILVNGQFIAIGSCEYLKAKYGRNFILSIKIVPGYHLTILEKIKKIINETFPTIRFKDSYLGVLKYELESGISYSYVFDKLEKLRQRYVWITDFSVTQPSMDEVFLTLVKKQKESHKKLTLYERLRSYVIDHFRCYPYSICPIRGRWLKVLS